MAGTKPLVSKGAWDKTTSKGGFQRFALKGDAFGVIYLPPDTKDKKITVTVQLDQ